MTEPKTKRTSRKTLYLGGGMLALVALVAYDLSVSVNLDLANQQQQQTTANMHDRMGEVTQSLLERVWRPTGDMGSVGEVLPELWDPSKATTFRKPTSSILSPQSKTSSSSSSMRLADVRSRHLQSTAPPPLGGRSSLSTVLTLPAQVTRQHGMDAVQESDLHDDPLRAQDWKGDFGSIALTRSIPYVGTLLDAGRHYFSVAWIKRMLDRMADMQLNLLHLRLTDDQTFNVLLQSRPALAYPTAVDNPNQLVYSVADLTEIAAHAKSLGISIMPEVNVPGHGGGWAGISNLVVQCPKFVCEKGYGLPVNVQHADFHEILADVLVELIAIFDPPFLHLGGDEVNMADPCFREAGIAPFDYASFEQALKQTLKDRVGYPEAQVVRWERTGQKQTERAGDIEQFWFAIPFERKVPKSDVYFASGRLYFDTNEEQDAFDVYSKTRQYFMLNKPEKTPTAIIAGTFELSETFWFDRNVLGKLLAVVMGASDQVKVEAWLGTPSRAPPQNRAELNAMHVEYCQQLGLGPTICGKKAVGVISFADYKRKWDDDWVIWKRDICERYADDEGGLLFHPYQSLQEESFQAGNEFFWSNFPAFGGNETLVESDVIPAPKSVSLDDLANHPVQYAGILLDTTTSLVPVARLNEIVQDYVGRLGLNLIQFPLVNNHGFVYKGSAQHDLAFSPLATKSNPVYDLYTDLRPLAEKAASMGIEFMPEIHVSSHAAGWFRAGFAVNCPKLFCSGGGLVNDVSNPLVLAVLFSVISEVHQAFGGPLFHLGVHDLNATLLCYQEAEKDAADVQSISQDLQGFEQKLEALMALAGIASNRIVRWSTPDDDDKDAFGPGSVKQYAPGQTATHGESAMVTVDIFKGDAFAVYQRVLQMIDTNPLGIVANIHSLTLDRWTELQVAQRLLAFSMGLSTLERLNQASTFAASYQTLCESLSWQDPTGSCAPPGVLGEEHDPSAFSESDAFRERHCSLHTKRERGKYVAKEIKPFYQDAIADSSS